MKIIGIDPGRKGAFAIVDNGNLLYREVFPTLLGELSIRRFVKRLMDLSMGVDQVLLERVHAIKNSSAGATFKFGQNYQWCIDAISMSGLPSDYVSPRVWQEAVFKNETVIKKPSGKKDTKKMAAKVAVRLFPGEEFLSTARSRNPHDGMVDAALIAYYGSVLRNKPKEG